MEYKITTVYGKVFYANNKKELFAFFDEIGGYWSINSKCGANFNISKEKGAVIIGYEIIETFGYKNHVPVYASSKYIIQDRHRYLVDYGQLSREYKESRNVKFYQSRFRLGEPRGFRDERKPLRNAQFKESKHSYKKEYNDLLGAKNEGVKVRNKRLSDLKYRFVRLYDDECYRSYKTKSWKDKKARKQWQKNNK